MQKLGLHTSLVSRAGLIGPVDVLELVFLFELDCLSMITERVLFLPPLM